MYLYLINDFVINKMLNSKQDIYKLPAEFILTVRKRSSQVYCSNEILKLRIAFRLNYIELLPFSDAVTITITLKIFDSTCDNYPERLPI